MKKEEILKLFETNFYEFRNADLDDQEFLKLYLEMRDFAPDFLKNKKVSSEFIDKIIVDADDNELWWIAGKNSLSSSQIEFLANHRSPEIRSQIAYHKKIPKRLLEKLSRDSSELVRDAASSRMLG